MRRRPDGWPAGCTEGAAVGSSQCVWRSDLEVEENRGLCSQSGKSAGQKMGRKELRSRSVWRVALHLGRVWTRARKNLFREKQ